MADGTGPERLEGLSRDPIEPRATCDLRYSTTWRARRRSAGPEGTERASGWGVLAGVFN